MAWHRLQTSRRCGGIVCSNQRAPKKTLPGSLLRTLRPNLKADCFHWADANDVAFLVEFVEAGERRVKGPFGGPQRPTALLKWTPGGSGRGHFHVSALYEYF